MVALVGCGNSTPRGTIEGPHRAEVEAPGPSAALYVAGEVDGEAVMGEPAIAASVRQGVQAASDARSMPLVGDPRLAQLAQWIVDRLGPNGEPPPTEVIEFFGQHLGLVEPVPHTLVLGEPAASLGAAVERSVGQFMERQTYNHFGAAVVTREGLEVAVVVLSWRWLELEPVPRRVDSGAAITLRGRLTGDHQNPSVVVARPGGDVQRLPAGSGPDFDVRVPTDAQGAFRIEILGRGQRGDTVIANFPVYVGTDIPHTVRTIDESGGGSDVESVRRELLAMIDRTRREAGVQSLRPHEGLDAVARAHSLDMAEHNFIGHTSPTTGTAADRVRRAQLRTGLVLENIGRGYGANEIHRGLVESPGHRANLINPDVTHVGIGVVPQSDGDRTAFVVTEVFIRQADRVDLSGAPEQLLTLINRARRARGAPEVSLEPPMSEAAQNAAQEFFSDPSLSQQDTVDDASASLRRFAIAYSRIGGVMAVVSDVSEAGALEPTLDAGIRFIGIGVAQGNRPDTGENAIAVVIVMAWPRTGGGR